jgi:nucleoside-diphosphate-sugar epimerase
MKKILVTGLSGFIGSHTVDFLIEKGYEIHAVSTKKRSGTKHINWYNFDLLDENKVKEFFKKTKLSYLLHFAWDVTHGEYVQSPKNYDWLIASINLLKNFKENGGQRAVVAGTQLEYSDNSPYPASKRALLEVLKSLDISYAWGRIFYLFGENEHSDRLVPYVINSLLNKEEVKCSNSEQICDFMYVKDVARAFVELLNSDVQGVVDIGSGEGIKIKDLIFKIADHLDGKDLIRLGALKISEQKNYSIIANNYRLKNEVKFVPDFSIDKSIENLIELSKRGIKW